MLRVMLLRHAKSDWSRSSLRDHDRPLNERGQDAAPRVGLYMKARGLVPQHVVVSTANRTRETWTLVNGELRAQAPVRFEARIYEASPHAILAVIKETPAAAKSVLVVGHNPGLQSLAIALVGSGDREARERLFDKFPTAGLAVIDFDASAWSAIRPGTGALERFVGPRMFAAAQI